MEEEESLGEGNEVEFKNPLADMDDEDLYISENEEEVDENVKVDPNEKMEGELSDDEAYVIPKPSSDMEKRRQQLKRNQEKKEKKLRKNIEEGEEVGEIEIVRPRQMEDYNIDELAETLVLAKKMLRKRAREEVIEGSSSRYSF